MSHSLEPLGKTRPPPPRPAPTMTTQPLSPALCPHCSTTASARSACAPARLAGFARPTTTRSPRNPRPQTHPRPLPAPRSLGPPFSHQPTRYTLLPLPPPHALPTPPLSYHAIPANHTLAQLDLPGQPPLTGLSRRPRFGRAAGVHRLGRRIYTALELVKTRKWLYKPPNSLPPTASPAYKKNYVARRGSPHSERST